MTPFVNSGFTFLEKDRTVSGQMLVALNVFDKKLPIGSGLVDADERVWEITRQDEIICRPSNYRQQEKSRNPGAVLFHIEPAGHNDLADIGDKLFPERNGG